jgi:hypothetical protein
MVMKGNHALYVLILCFVGISGCSILTPPMEKPIIEDHSRGITTFGTIPSRRMVIVMPENGSNAGNVFVCAEPSPDVSDNIAGSLAAAASGKGLPIGSASTAEVSVSVSRAMATTAQFLFKRTQGMQLYRDGMYNLCQARMNRIISDVEFNTQSNALLEKTVILINAELPYLYSSQLSSTSTAPSTTNPTPNATRDGAPLKP